MDKSVIYITEREFQTFFSTIFNRHEEITQTDKLRANVQLFIFSSRP